jgi:outer membrane protein assembly factor BamB
MTHGRLVLRLASAISLLVGANAFAEEWTLSVNTKPLRKDVDRTPEWPMFGGTPSRNMVNPFEKGMPTQWVDEDDEIVGLKWKAVLGTRTYGGPVVAGGRVFVGTNNQNPRNKADVQPDGTAVDLAVLMCFRESDGAFLWQATHPKLESGRANDWPKEGLASMPAVEANRLYYVSNRCELICADVQDGKAVWRLDLIGELGVFPHSLSTCSPLIVGDLIFAVTANGVDEGHLNIPAPKAPSFVAVNKRTGKVAWQDNSPTAAMVKTKLPRGQLVDEGRVVLEGQWSNPSFADAGGQRQVIFPGGDGWLRAFVPETGRLLWKFDCNPKAAKFDLGGKGTRSDFIATPVVHEGRLYIGVGQNPEHNVGVGHLWCIDLARAVAKGAQNPDRDVSPREDNFDAGAAVNRDSALTWHYGGFATKELAQRIKRRIIFGRTMSTCAVHQGLVYAVDFGGWLHCVDAATGKALWAHDTEAQTWASPLCVDGKVYVGNDEGRVTVFAQGTEKRILAENEMTELIRVGPVAANGVLYVISGATLHALRRP